MIRTTYFWSFGREILHTDHQISHGEHKMFQENTSTSHLEIPV